MVPPSRQRLAGEAIAICIQPEHVYISMWDRRLASCTSIGALKSRPIAGYGGISSRMM